MAVNRSISGVELRKSSILLKFTLNGNQERRTLMGNGAPLFPSSANIKYAERLVADIKHAIRLDRFKWEDFFPDEGTTKVGYTVADQLADWLAVQRVTNATKMSYHSCANFWYKTICNRKGAIVSSLPVQDLTFMNVKFAIASRSELKGKTVNNYLQVLREAMDQAKYDGLITVNPVIDPKSGVSIRVKDQKPEADPFSSDEADRIVASMQEKYPEQIGNFTEFWLWTGLRTGELLALQWKSIDFTSGYFQVHETIVRGEHQDKTKTNKSRRVKLNSHSLAALQRQKKHTYLAGGRVFNDPRYDQPWIDERAFRRSFWAPTLKRLGLHYRRPYNCRHTYATALIMANANHKWAAGQLGHSVEMFQKTYTTWIDGDQNEAEIAKLEANLKSHKFSALATVNRLT
jgi:integrase